MWYLQKTVFSFVWESVEKVKQKTYEQTQAKAVLKHNQMPGHLRLTSFPAASLHPVRPQTEQSQPEPVSQIAKAIWALAEQNR